MSHDHPSYFANHSRPLDPDPTDSEIRLPQLEKVDAVVFDIYGTLIISAAGDISLADENASLHAMETALAAVDCKRDPAEALQEYHEGIGLAQKETRERGVEFPEVEIREIWADILEDDLVVEQAAVAYECAANPVWPMPGLAEVIKEIGQKNIPLGIVSNAQFYTQHMFPAFLGSTLEELGFDPELMIFSYQEREGKPSRNLYRKLSDRLTQQGLVADHTLYVGNDLRKDIAPAQAEGFVTALFAGDARSLRLYNNEVEPDAVVTELGQILEMLPSHS